MQRIETRNETNIHPSVLGDAELSLRLLGSPSTKPGAD